jgi:Amt family ammonium transporter
MYLLCNGVGGMTGMLLTGVFASKTVNSAVTDQGLYLGETTCIYPPTNNDYCIHVAFSASYFLFFVC